MPTTVMESASKRQAVIQKQSIITMEVHLSGLVKTTTGNTGTTKTTVQFVYDAEGKPLLLRFNGKTDYFYLYNGLGDITGLVDSSNKVVVRYQYNSWGKSDRGYQWSFSCNAESILLPLCL